MKHFSLKAVVVWGMTTLIFSCSQKDEYPASVSTGPWVMVYNDCVNCDEINASFSGNTDHIRMRIPYLANQGYQTLHPDYYAIAFYNNIGKVTATADYHFYAQKYYTVFLTGYQGNGNAIVLENKTSSTGADETKIRFLNTSADGEVFQLHFGKDEKTALLQYKDVSPYYAIYKGSNTVYLTDAEGNKIVSKTFMAAANSTYTLLVASTKNRKESDSLQIVCLQE